MDGAHLARTRQIAEVLDINVNGAGALARMAALLDAIAAKTLTADEITTASERGAKAALDARITAATVTLDVTTDHGADQ